jgi:hypothetical protein
LLAHFLHFPNIFKTKKKTVINDKTKIFKTVLIEKKVQHKNIMACTRLETRAPPDGKLTLYLWAMEAIHITLNFVIIMGGFSASLKLSKNGNQR